MFSFYPAHHDSHVHIVKKMKTAEAVSTPTVPEPSEEANSRVSSPGMTKDEASQFPGTGCSCELFESGPARLAVRGEGQ